LLDCHLLWHKTQDNIPRQYFPVISLCTVSILLTVVLESARILI